MKSRTRKRIFRGAAAALACVAAAGIFLQTTMSVEAAANSLPGIDIIVKDNSSEKPFRILELVDNSENAEIGYYVSGQEPTVKLYTYTDADGNQIHFSTFEEGLSQLPEKERKEFAMNVKIDENGDINRNESTGISKVEMEEKAEEASPISYKGYQEKYFLENSDNEAEWTQIDLKDAEGNSRVDSVEAKGSYVENQAGTGDYTKEEQQYYPIRGNVPADNNGAELFRENIQSFSYVEDEDTHGAYFLQFAEVDNADVNAAFNEDENDQSALEKIQSEYDYTNGHYGYYENVYTDLTENIVENINDGKYTFPGEEPDDSAIVGDNSNAVLVQNNAIQSAQATGQERLGDILDDATAGTQENPYIYLGETIEEYPYYQYTLVGDLQYVQKKEAETHKDGYEYEDGSIILEDGQYWYLVEEDDRFVQTELSIVTGRQQVAYEDVASIPEDLGYNYYYVVNQVWFCSELSNNGSAADPSDYQFFGWYYPTYPSGEDVYLPISDGERPTYYISEAQYTLTPGIGDYDFVPGGDETQLVQVNQMYYRGGYENHDWLKKYVFHLEKDEYDGFNIQVDTRYADDARIPVYAGVEENKDDAVDTDVASYDLIYVNGKLSEDLAASIASSNIPCIINMDNADNDYLRTAFTSSLKEDTDGNYVNKKLYFLKGSDDSELKLVNDDFAKTFTDAQTEGFEEITKYIEQENQYRALGENGSKLDPLSLELSQARAVEYIINYQYKRTIDVKSEINVLQIMPDVGCDEIAEDDITQWLTGGQDQTTEEHGMTVTTCCEQKGNEAAPASEMTDNDPSTYWHSDWSNQWSGNKHDPDNKQHFIDVTFDELEDIQGFIYSPRINTKYPNGTLMEYKVELYDNNDKQIGDAITGKTGYNIDNYSGNKTITFPDIVSSVKRMRIYFVSAVDTQASPSFESTRCASCAELKILYAEREVITACCAHTTGNEITPDTNMSDGNPNTFWHSNYSNSTPWNDPVHQAETEKKHYIQVDFTNPEEVKGFSYTPRSDNTARANGTLVKYTVKLYDSDGQIIETITGDTGYTKDNFVGKKVIKFSQAFSSVKRMRIYFESSLYDKAANDEKTSDEFASCAELKILYSTADVSDITVTNMTASEFVGHIDDLASEYDMIYICGHKINSSDPAITGGDDLCYAHVGDGVLIGTETAEETDKDKKNAGPIKSVSDEILKLLGQLDNEYLWNADGTKATDENGKYLFAPIATYQDKQGGGFFRGSGNDMTSQKCEELLDFVKSGYPVVVSSTIIDNNKVNENVVDNSSYYYEFLSKALDYNNFCTSSELNSGTKNLRFFANLAKPVINLQEKPKDPPRTGESVGGDLGYINGELKYSFSISNDSDAAPADTTYDCKLYLDLNFDGNLSEKEEQSKYIVIEDADGKVVSQVADADGGSHYELSAGKNYTLTRKIPSDYYKIITWKLEVSSNRNNYIHTSEMGYAKQKRPENVAKQVINVLQIVPYDQNQNDKTQESGNWDLSRNTAFKNMIADIDDFEICVEVVSVDQVDAYKQKSQMEALLKDVQMLVIGFNDSYKNISNEHQQVDAILDYIKKGKSIIFSHDTTSYVNYARSDMHPTIAINDYSEENSPHIYYDVGIINKNANWGLSLNTTLRSVVGMDRYGITSTDKISDSDDTTVSSLLKKGKGLTDGNQVSFAELMKAAGDIAYTAGGNRQTSYAQTQSYSNNLVNSRRMGGGTSLTSKATKVNDGAITQYPYRMEDSIDISETHWQYYQLGLEQDRDINGNSDGKSDVVVWYCLSGSPLYSSSPNDVRNNYYFYSKGNVIYTGSGHSKVNNKTEMKLFINAMVAAANVTAVDPEVNFVDELNPTADVESTRYYSTDQSSWTGNEANVLEQSMDFYVNVKDYNMVSADLNQDDLDKQKMTLEFYIDSDDGDTVDGAPYTSKMTNITKDIGSLKGYDGTTAEVSSDGAFHLTQNTAYQLTLSNLEQYLRTSGSAASGDQNGYRKDCKLYVKVTSTVYLYGEPKTSTSWADIDLKQRQLFELN